MRCTGLATAGFLAATAAAVCALIVRQRKARALAGHHDAPPTHHQPAPPAKAHPRPKTRLRAYLAGPEVFLPRDVSARVAAAKVAICDRYNIEGINPMDLALDLSGMSKSAAARRIANKDFGIMYATHMAIICLTPFRGPSADVGTVLEMGFMRGQGRPVFAYSNDRREFAVRTRMACRVGTDAHADLNGMAIEPWDCVDNLMLDGACADSVSDVLGMVARGVAASEVPADVLELCDGRPCVPRRGEAAADGGGDNEPSDAELPGTELYTDLRQFERAVRAAAAWVCAKEAADPWGLRRLVATPVPVPSPSDL